MLTITTTPGAVASAASPPTATTRLPLSSNNGRLLSATLSSRLSQRRPPLQRASPAALTLRVFRGSGSMASVLCRTRSNTAVAHTTPTWTFTTECRWATSCKGQPLKRGLFTTQPLGLRCCLGSILLCHLARQESAIRQNAVHIDNGD